MKTASAGLNTLVQGLIDHGGLIYIADLYTFTLLDGTVQRWTSYDASLTYEGHVFTATGPLLSRSNIRSAVGLEVGELKIVMQADPSHVIPKVGGGTQPVLQAIAQDRFAGANVTVDRLLMPSPFDTSNGALILSGGSVADAEIKRLSAAISARSPIEKLDVMLPQSVIGPNCRHILYGPSCTLDRTAFQQTGTVTSGSTRYKINTGLTPAGSVAPPVSAPTLTQSSNSDANIPTVKLYVVITYVSALGETIASPESSRTMSANNVLHVASPPSVTGALGWNVYVSDGPGDGQRQNQAPIAIGTGWTEPADGLVQGVSPLSVSTTGFYADGVIQFTSGVCAGLTRGIQGNAGGALSLWSGLPQAPVAGDAFIVVPGCDKAIETCSGKFSNLVNFGGQPFVPVPEVGL